MGRIITVAMKCDRCGVDYEGDEIDLLERDSQELVDGAKERLSDTPAFSLKMGEVDIKYDDVCSNCRDRLASLAKDCGPVNRRGYKRGANVKQQKLEDKNKAAKPPQAPKAPSKPKSPTSPPASA